MKWPEFIQRLIVGGIILAVGGYLLTITVDPAAWFIIILVFGLGGLNMIVGNLGQF